MPETVELSAPEIPFCIEYSRAAMEQIRERAEEGSRALPRFGIGVGGLLLGDRQNGKTRVLDSVGIPCSHANGPSFNLTDEEKQNARGLAAGSKNRLIGWYCSKTRGEAVLNDFDTKCFNDLLPGPDKLALIVRPSLAGPMRFVFYIREANGAVAKALECEVAPWKSEEDQPLDAVVPSGPAKLPEPAAAEVPLEPPAEPPESPRATSSTFPGLLGAYGLEPPQPRRRANKLIWVLAAASLSAAGGALFVTKDSWMPRPPLTLSSSASDGSITIRWNNEALRGVDHATLYVNDGGHLETLPLDRLRLNSGFLIYTPKSQRITAKMDAGGVTAITAWFAPAPKGISDPTATPNH